MVLDTEEGPTESSAGCGLMDRSGRMGMPSGGWRATLFMRHQSTVGGRPGGLPAILACDLGGTFMKMGVVGGGQVLARAALPVDAQVGLGPVLPSIKGVWMELLAGLGLGVEDCVGVSVASPSLIDVGAGRILTDYGKYPDAPGLDLREWSAKEFGLPLAVDNDARMALIGEWRYGAGRGSDDVVMLTLGTGLGTAAVIRGQVLRGRHGQAGILGGHTSVRYGGRACSSCGSVGCAEAEASSTCLAELASGHSGFAASLLAREPRLDFAAVFRHAAAGDGIAIRLRDHSLLVWATLAVNLVHSYDPEILVLGGGIMGSGEVILPYMSDYLAAHAHTPWGRVRVVASELRDGAALVAGEWLLGEQYPDLRLHRDGRDGG